jgi:hypothetical protein
MKVLSGMLRTLGKVAAWIKKKIKEPVDDLEVKGW